MPKYTSKQASRQCFAELIPQPLSPSPAKSTLSLLIASILAFYAPLTAAEDITYTGDASMLRNSPSWLSVSNSLYPGDGVSSASGNTVTIHYAPGTGMANPAFVFGGLSENGNVTGNTVIMHNGNVESDIGTTIGYIYGGVSDSGNAMHNAVTINGGNAGYVIGGHSDSGNATYNTVIINGGSVTYIVYGGRSISGTANYNTVIINGGSIAYDVRGGETDTGNATYNTVTIGKNAMLGASTQLAGGAGMGGSGDRFTGNTLNIAGTHAVADISNFQYLNFTIDNDTGTANPQVSAGAVSLGGASTVQGINIATGGTAHAAGTTVTLLQAGAGGFTGTIDNTTATGMKGMSLLYEWDNIGIANDALTARVAGVTLNPQTHSLLSGRAVQTALVNQGADLIVNRGMRNLRQSAKAGQQGFFAMQGGASRYETGSGIDMDSFSLMAGAAWGTTLSSGPDLALGAFVETGTGSYSSSNSFTGMSSVRGSGNTDFIGVGVLGSLEWANGFYVDASLRGGRVESDLSTNLTLGGEWGQYDEAGSLYIGAHAGVGYNWAISSVDTLDVYTRYLWTHTDSDSVTVLGDKYHFDSSDSHRWRTGMKYGRTIGGFTPYAGVAYEFEFDGRAGGSVHGYKLRETDMGGSTWIGELGFAWQPKGYENTRLDLSLEGFAGQRDGVMANARFNYRF